MASFRSVAMWHDSAGNECECEVDVEYKFHRGSPQTLVDPEEPASVEVYGVTPVSPDYDIPGSAIDLEAFADECMQDHFDRAEAGAEAAAEARAEMRMLDRG